MKTVIAIKSKNPILKDSVQAYCDRMKSIQHDCKQDRNELMRVIETCETDTHKECPIRNLLKEKYIL